MPKGLLKHRLNVPTALAKRYQGVFRLYVGLILLAELIVLALLPALAPGVSVIPFAAIPPLTLVIVFILWGRRIGAGRMRNISPEQITRQQASASAVDQDPATPESLSQLIVERTAEIRRTLAESPSEIQVEMCVLGYHACVNDMISLTHLANEELQNASLVRRFVLRRARRRATDALTNTRAALPPGALSATRQEQQ